MTETTSPAALAELCAPGFAADGDRSRSGVRCNGINHNHHGARGVCTACGAEVVRTRSGKLHPVLHYTTEYGNPREAFACYRGEHACTPQRVEARRLTVATWIERGELFVGAPVAVVRGRKVPVGTTGTLSWVGEGGYGPRVGLRDAEGQVHWTAASNVELRVPAALAAEAAALTAAARAADEAARDAHDAQRIAATVRAAVVADIVAMLRANGSALDGKAVERFDADGASLGTATVLAACALSGDEPRFGIEVLVPDDGRRVFYAEDDLGDRFRFAEPLG